MQLAALSQSRVSSSPPLGLGVHSSGLFGDVRPGNFAPHLRVVSDVGRPLTVRSCTGAPTSSNGDGATSSFPKELPTRPTSSTATSDRKFSRPAPFSGFSGSLGLNFPGSQIPGLPGSPRPKPGTPRPYDPTKQKSKVMEWLTPPKPPTELLQREHFKLSPTCLCTIYFGDLSKWFVDGKSDAVIAPANKKLNTGPAVNAVLFKAAGSKLLECTQRLPDVAPQGIKAEMGDAISTRAFDLPVHRIIHTVGAVHKKNEKTGVRESDPTLEKAYRTALMVARHEKLKYLAFPPLSCNIYGYPYADGAEVALRTLKAHCDGFERIDIVIRNIEGYEAFIDEANKVLDVIREKKTIKIPARTADHLPPAAAEAFAATQPAPGVPTTPAELYPMPATPAPGAESPQAAATPAAEAAASSNELFPSAPTPPAAEAPASEAAATAPTNGVFASAATETPQAAAGATSSPPASPAAAPAAATTPPPQTSQAPPSYSQGYGYGATQSSYSQSGAPGGYAAAGAGQQQQQQQPYSQAAAPGGYSAAGSGPSSYSQAPPAQGGYGTGQSPYSQAPAPGGYQQQQQQPYSQGPGAGQSPYSRGPAPGGYSAAPGTGQPPYSQAPGGGQPGYGGYGAAQSPYSRPPGGPGSYPQAPPQGQGYAAAGAGTQQQQQQPYSQSQPPRPGGYSAAGAPGGYSAAGAQQAPGAGYSQQQPGGYGGGYPQGPPRYQNAPPYQNYQQSPPQQQQQQQQQYNQNAPPYAQGGRYEPQQQQQQQYPPPPQQQYNQPQQPPPPPQQQQQQYQPPPPQQQQQYQQPPPQQQQPY